MTSIAPPASNPELPVVFGTGSALGSESRLQPHPFNPAESLATDETPMEHGLYHFTMIIVIKLGRARRSARAVRTRAQNWHARSDAPCHRGIDADRLPRMVLGTENCFFRPRFYPSPANNQFDLAIRGFQRFLICVYSVFHPWPIALTRLDMVSNIAGYFRLFQVISGYLTLFGGKIICIWSKSNSPGRRGCGRAGLP